MIHLIQPFDSDLAEILVDNTLAVKYNRTKFEQETQQWWPGMGAASGGSKFQDLSKLARKMTVLRCIGCLGCWWRGLFALEPTMMNKHLGTVWSSFCTRLVAPRTPFGGLKVTKSALEVTFYFLIFQVSPSFVVLVYCLVIPCGDKYPPPPHSYNPPHFGKDGNGREVHENVFI
jgi:hypothetical protein